MRGETVLRYRPVHVRHVVDVPQGTPGAVQVLGRWLAPGDRRGVNGPDGWVSAEIEERMLEHGTGRIVFPNAVGGDGVRHIDRFSCLGTTAKGYAPGDEWLEVYEGPPPHGDLLAVVTPLEADSRRTGGIELQCADGLWLLNKTRETDHGYWHHAPRDAMEHYSGAWIAPLAEDFDRQDLTLSAAAQTTGDGKLTYRSGRSLVSSVELQNTGYIRGAAPIAATARNWRIEARITPRSLTDPGFAFGALTANGTPNGPAFYFFSGGGTASSGNNRPSRNVKVTPDLFPVTLAIEVRDLRWVFMYVNGRLVALFRWFQPAAAYYAAVSHAPEDADDQIGVFATVETMLVREMRPFLMRGAEKGDYRLPGLPVPGGLTGEYFNDVDVDGDLNRVLAPGRVPYQRRLDASIEFPGPPSFTEGWEGPGGPPPGKSFSVRWTGSIRLGLAFGDVRLSVANLDDSCRLWVGRTRFGDQLIDQWTPAALGTFQTPWLRALLGVEDGWYPIVLEYANQSGPRSITLRVENAAIGQSTVVSPTILSPLGIYSDHVRHESHHDALEKIAGDFGLQYRLEPRQLESGEFPGRIVPRVRLGRDTDHAITDTGAIDVSAKLSAQEVAHAMLIDGAGVSDDANAAQLTSEAIDFDAVGEHLIVHQAAESLADIQTPGLLQQRATTLLALLASPWEEVNARDLRENGLKDAFPLTGQLAALQVGDGVRLLLDSIGVRDATPRQMLGRTRALVPDGASVPVARFRQRPRSRRDTLRRILKTAVAPQRNYQGTLSKLPGNVATHPAQTYSPDPVSRVSLPADPTSIVKAELVVHYVTDPASIKTILVAGVSTALTLTGPGRYDVTAFARADGTTQRIYAGLSGGAGVTEFQLELTVRI